MIKKVLFYGSTATLALAAGLYGSHSYQLSQIEHEANQLRKSAVSNTIEEDIIAIKKETTDVIKEYGGGLEFIYGDFDIRDKQARCGGIARKICLSAASKGFETDIHFEWTGFCRAHYYAVLTRGGYTIRLDGHPEQLKEEFIEKPSITPNTMLANK